MTKNRNLIIALIVLLSTVCVLLIGIMVYAISGGGHKLDFDFDNNKNIVYDQNFDAKQINGLNVTTNVGDITIKSSNDTGTIRVVARGGKADTFSAELANGILTLDNDSGNYNVFSKMFFNNIYSDIEVYLPEGFTKPMQLTTETGDIDIDCPVNCKLRVETDTGDVEAYSLKGSFNIDCDTGDVEIKSIEIISDSSVSTDTGEITIDRTNDINILANNSIGDTDVFGSNPSAPVTLTAESDVGDIEINKD